MTFLVGFIGDSHGNTPFMCNGIRKLAGAGCQLIWQVGDFGFWPTKDGARYVDAVRTAAEEAGVGLWVTEGNHDDPEMFEPYSTIKPSLTGFHHLPRGMVVQVGNRIAMSFGGGISIDREYRIPGRSWWASEAATDEQIESAIANAKAVGHVDLIVAHDAPWVPPVMNHRSGEFSGKLGVDLDEQRARLNWLYYSVKPQLWIHGHYHVGYLAAATHGDIKGLDAENASAYHIVDMDDPDW